MEIRVRTAAGGIYLVDTTVGKFIALDPTANRLLDQLGVPLPPELTNLSQRNRDEIRQLVLSVARPRVDG